MSVPIGNLLIGKQEPILIQSMTNTDTNDVEASVAQCIRLIDAGADMVRLTVQGMKEVESFRKIHSELRKRNYSAPLVADVHFLPKVALEVAAVAEKVRINPGNYMDRNYEGPERFNQVEQTRQIKLIAERLAPLAEVCRKHDTTIRIGVNHGSLSKRILSWYGNTAQGMVESAHEFIRAFGMLDFQRLVISLKSSDPWVMVLANRLFTKRMYQEGLEFPVHLGVTEAGSDEDGRIRSASGIVPLLSDGIGDTIRISLTEDPEKEIPVAKYLAQRYGLRGKTPDFLIGAKIWFNTWERKRRLSLPSEKIGGHHKPVVITTVRTGFENPSYYGFRFREDQTLETSGTTADYLYAEINPYANSMPAGVPLILPYKEWKALQPRSSHVYPMIHWEDIGAHLDERFGLHFIRVHTHRTDQRFFQVLDNDMYGVLVAELPEDNAIESGMKFFKMLWEINNLLPVILYKKITEPDPELAILQAAGDMSNLLISGFGDGIWIDFDGPGQKNQDARQTAFSVLQSLKLRISGTEYISCPTCGRTQFDIQGTLRKVKEATAGRVGLKIAVMGCIVNGPGEMSDADYGYVGAGPGRVTLYRKGEAVLKNIPEETAISELLKIMESDVS